MTFASSIATMDRVVDSLDGAFQDSEQTFGAIGAGLGDAIVAFSTLTKTFETLATSLENEDMCNAADRLTKIAGAVDSTKAALESERVALGELLTLNREIAAGLERVQSGARTMTILTLNAKIEAARIDGDGEDLSIFSIEMARTVKTAQDTVELHGSAQADLIHLLEVACTQQEQFEGAHREKIAAISCELSSAFLSVDERRRRAASIACGIGQRSMQISSAIGSAIIALQIGDNTRQRIEHVVSSLRMLRADLPADSVASGEELSAEDRATARVTMSLEAAQIDAALNGFEDGVGQIRYSLARLAEDCTAIGQEGKQICGAGDGAPGSFFAALKDKLVTSKKLMHECAAASASVDDAKASALGTLVSLQERMKSLNEAVKQMTLVGINAALKSRHFGPNGLGLGVIAEQLRTYAKQISVDAEELMPALSRAIALAHGLEARRAKVIGMDDYEGELTKALDSFDDIAVRLDHAFASLLADLDKLGDFLGASVRDLAPQDELCAVLRAAGHDLEDLVRELPETSIDEPAAAFLDALWPLYTMDGERVVHRRFRESFGGDAEFECSRGGVRRRLVRLIARNHLNSCPDTCWLARALPSTSK